MTEIILREVADKLDDVISDKDMWVKAEGQRGARVKLYRRYYDGNHPSSLTNEMRQILNMEPPSVNYCVPVVDSVVDRLKLQGLSCGDEQAQQWMSDVYARNRVDALQYVVHKGAVRDGISYVMVSADDGRQVMLTHEPAYDGHSGMIVIYDENRSKPIRAVKIQYDGVNDYRYYIYYPDRVDKYTSGGEGVESVAWQVGEVPVVAFRNRAEDRLGEGKSELANVIGLQDSVNMCYSSLVAVIMLNGFPVVATNFDATDESGQIVMRPGTVFSDVGGGDKDPKIVTMVQATPAPFIDAINHSLGHLSMSSATPLRSLLGSQLQSGEALKRRQTDLTGKVVRVMTGFGNAWEDVMTLGTRVSNTFGGKTLTDAVWTAEWADHEVLDDKDIVDNAIKLYKEGLLGRRDALAQVARITDWSPEQVDDIVSRVEEEKAEELGLNVRAVARTLPGFELTADDTST